MYIVDQIAYASTEACDMRVAEVRPLQDMMLLLTFASGEKRLYDATSLLAAPAFQPLRDEAIFRAARVEHGVVTWLDGEIDVAPETMYRDSFAYEDTFLN